MYELSLCLFHDLYNLELVSVEDNLHEVYTVACVESYGSSASCLSVDDVGLYGLSVKGHDVDCVCAAFSESEANHTVV